MEVIVSESAVATITDSATTASTNSTGETFQATDVPALREFAGNGNEAFEECGHEFSSNSPIRKSLEKSMLERELYLSTTVESLHNKEDLQLSKELSTSTAPNRLTPRRFLWNSGDQSVVVESLKRTSSFTVGGFSIVYRFM